MCFATSPRSMATVSGMRRTSCMCREMWLAAASHHPGLRCAHLVGDEPLLILGKHRLMPNSVLRPGAELAAANRADLEIEQTDLPVGIALIHSQALVVCDYLRGHSEVCRNYTGRPCTAAAATWVGQPLQGGTAFDAARLGEV